MKEMIYVENLGHKNVVKTVISRMFSCCQIAVAETCQLNGKADSEDIIWPSVKMKGTTEILSTSKLLFMSSMHTAGYIAIIIDRMGSTTVSLV